MTDPTTLAEQVVRERFERWRASEEGKHFGPVTEAEWSGYMELSDSEGYTLRAECTSALAAIEARDVEWRALIEQSVRSYRAEHKAGEITRENCDAKCVALLNLINP